MARSITATGMGPPPYERARNDGSPPPSASITSRMRLSIVGTTMAWVMPSARTTSTHALGSNASTCTTRRPEYVDDNTDDTLAM